MPRPLLMILDGGFLKTPALERAFESAGWDLTWVMSPNANPLPPGPRPDAVLAASPANPAASAVLRGLRMANPGLAYVVVGPGLLASDLGSPAGRLDPAANPEQWTSVFAGLKRPMAADGGKFTAEDLFGDIVADLEGAPEPEFLTDSLPGVAAPAPLPTPALPDFFESLLGPVDGASHKSVPLADDFTLSGFSGIKDPFAMPEADLADRVPSAPATPAAKLATLVPAPAEAPAPEEFGNYFLLEKIAVGGMAELFKARQRGVHDFQKIVAIKRILPHLSDNDEFVRMFIDEAKLAAQLTHPNIVQIFDLGRAAGFYYIAMEYVDGKDLRSILRKVREYKSPLPESVAAFVVMRVANALDYAHRKRGMDDKELRLVHRDVSPQNVLISTEGAVKLVDFGIAKAATKSTQTMAGALKGKLLYMSPEQALGQSLDSRSDIYSLGLVLFELLTGERCFQADSELGVLEKVRLGKVADVRTYNPSVSREMIAILEKALQKNLDFRYASARAMEKDLKDLVVAQGGEPNEHEVAEFVNMLLHGTRDQVELLLATRFKRSTPPEPVMVRRSDLPSGNTVTMASAPKPRPASPRHFVPPPKSSQVPKWLVALLALGVLAVILLFYWVLV
ncbi:MAG: serine/threonine protein kinase [Holophagaceae bacterium]|nr:serine/threonine protein kinase [Holophagaceae bacterium]